MDNKRFKIISYKEVQRKLDIVYEKIKNECFCSDYSCTICTSIIILKEIKTDIEPGNWDPSKEELYTDEEIEEYLKNIYSGEGIYEINKIYEILSRGDSINQPIYKPLRSFLIRSLGEILDKKDANEALRIKKKKGRPHKNPIRDLIIGMSVHQKIEEGESYLDAINSVSIEFFPGDENLSSEHTVKKIYDNFKKELTKENESQGK